MAKSTTRRQSPKKDTAKIEEAEVVETTAEEIVDPAEPPADADATPEVAEIASDSVIVEAAEVVEESADLLPDVDESDAQDDVSAEAAPADPPAPAPTPPEPNRADGILVPLILGGLLAGAIGFWVAWYSLPKPDPDLGDRVLQQQAQISDLRDQIAALANAGDDYDAESAITGMAAGLTTQIEVLSDEITANLAGLEARIATLETSPNADGSLSEAGQAIYDQQIAALRDEVSSQNERMQLLASQAAQQLEQTRNEVVAIEANASQAAQRAAASAAVAQIRAAVENGTPFRTALPDLEAAIDTPVPAALERVARDGVLSLPKLQEMFPEAARNALAEARANNVDGESGGFAAFLREQFDVRSVEPRQGEDADAILSRAEASVGAGRLRDALAEIEGLPEIARVELSDWVAAASARIDALSAIETLTMSLN